MTYRARELVYRVSHLKGGTLIDAFPQIIQEDGVTDLLTHIGNDFVIGPFYRFDPMVRRS